MRSRWSAAIPLAVAVAAFLCFLPALSGGFLTYDDQALLTDNAAFLRGAWRDPRWLLTTAILNVHQPLAWLSYGIDYALFGLDPFCFHLTSLLLHALNAVVFYFLALRLFPRVSPDSDRFAAAAAALAFCLHPLRAECVAWVAERRELLSDLFFLLTLHAYLESAR